MLSMTLAEKIGQLVMVGVDGQALDSSTRTLLEEYYLGGFILFARNIHSPEQGLALVNSLKQANKGNQAPLFLSIDEEGGRVSRLPAPFIKLPASRLVGALRDRHLAFQLGSVLGRRVKALGLNLNFAPVLDINSNAANPVIGDRAFGSQPNLVTMLGIETMKGIQAEGVIPAVKHFPGHGDASVDSHVGLPRVEADVNRLHSFELVPFQEAIRNGAEMIMTAHILLPQLDPVYPATLSRAILTGLLRQKLDYDGVVITDDLTMGAIRENYKLEDAAVLAINAGADIVLVCHGYENYVTVLSALKGAVQEGRIPEERIDQALSRILALKQRRGLTDEIVGPVNIHEVNQFTRQALQGL